LIVENHFPDIPKQYQPTFSILHNIVVTLNWKLKKLSIYDNPQYIRLMNESAPGFFSLVRGLLVDSIILDLCNITDKKMDNLNYYKLLRIAEKNYEKNVDVEKLLGDFNKLREEIKPISTQRNKRIGHLDDHVTLKRYYDEKPLEPISYKLLFSSIQRMNDLMNAFLQCFSNSENIYYTKLLEGDEIQLMGIIQANTK
jgi:hypothetical protein